MFESFAVIYVFTNGGESIQTTYTFAVTCVFTSDKKLPHHEIAFV